MTSPVAEEFRITVRLPEPLRDEVGPVIEIDERVRDLGELIDLLEKRVEGFASTNDELYNFAVNGAMILHGERETPLRSGDEVEMIAAFSGG
ncbi:MAG: MoaD/ThiS family protein [Thermoanaerobaculia bacterium]|nr:MoaD/ThiS family protein [Thermoanaerobaculia bacterium]